MVPGCVKFMFIYVKGGSTMTGCVRGGILCVCVCEEGVAASCQGVKMVRASCV